MKTQRARCLGANHPKRGTPAVRRANIMQRRAATIAAGTKRRWW